MTKKQLIQYLKKNDACEPAISWLEEQKAFGPELIEQCPSVDWLCWLMPFLGQMRDRYDAQTKSLKAEYNAKEMASSKELEVKTAPIYNKYNPKIESLSAWYRS